MAKGGSEGLGEAPSSYFRSPGLPLDPLELHQTNFWAYRALCQFLICFGERENGRMGVVKLCLMSGGPAASQGALGFLRRT